MTKELAKQPSRATTLHTMLATYKTEIANALPRHVSPDRMLRIAMTSARKTPALLECSPESFLGAVIQSAQLGLEPDTPLGHAWLLPFYNKETGQKEVNFMPGYRGYMELIYRAQNHPILNPVAVFAGDFLEYERGLNPVLIHRPMPHDGNAKLTHAYVVANFPDGRKEFDIMTRDEIEAVRARSKAQKFTPWNTDYAAMACKSVIRRFAKYLPMSAELQTAIGLDDMADNGQSQNNDAWAKLQQAVQTKVERVQSKMEKTSDSDYDPSSFENFRDR